jgi:hypothetical protein
MITLRARVDAVGRALVAGNGRTSDQPLARVPVSARVAAYGAAAWAVGFAGVNIYLQIVGIDSGQIQRNWTAFTIANLGVVVLKLVGAAVALATVQPWGRRLPAPLLTVSAWGAAGVLLLYAIAGLLSAVAAGALTTSVLAGGTFRVPAWAYLGFFALGGLLFAVTAWQHQQRTVTLWPWMVVGLLGAPLLLGAVLFGSSLVF